MSQIMKGRKKPLFSEQHLENLRKSHLGQKQSPETIEKRSKALKESHRKRKELHEQLALEGGSET